VNRELTVEPEAESEIAEAANWYDRRVPGVGEEFVLAVDAALAAVQRNPFQYQAVWGQYRRARVQRFPYGLIYVVSDREI
jgi:hypothetical protein